MATDIVTATSDNVTNTYTVLRKHPEFSYLEIGHNYGHYAMLIIVNTRFVNELRNFVWTSGYDRTGRQNEYASTYINNDGRQVLERLGIRQVGKFMFIHRFIAALVNPINGPILSVLHIGDTSDNRLENLQIITQSDRERLKSESEQFFENWYF